MKRDQKFEPNWRGNQVLLAEAEQELNNQSLPAPQQQAQLSQSDQVDPMVEQVMAMNRARRAQLGIPEQPQISIPDPTPQIQIPK